MSISRNSPCPCGSGKKYKQCCGKLNNHTASEENTTTPSPDPVDLLQAAWAHHQAGRFQQAGEAYQLVLRTEPENTDALNLLGTLALQLGRHDMAVNLLTEAVRIRPGQAVYLGNLGNAQRALGLQEKALASYGQALALDAQYAIVYNNRGVCLKDMQRLDEAVPDFRRATDLKSDFVEAWRNLGNALVELRRFDEAEPVLHHLEALSPDIAELYFGLGQIHASRINGGQQAISCYEKCLSLDPEFASAHLSLSFLLLAGGELKRGWQAFTWRTRVHSGLKRPYPAPIWRDEPVSGKTVLVWGEQGIGDEILFASCLSDLHASGAYVLLECEPRLVPLFTRSFPWAKIYGRTQVDESVLMQTPVDFQFPAGSLPGIFRNQLADFSDKHAYLLPDSASVQKRKQWLSSLGSQPKVGISWRSMRRGADRDGFYTEISQWQAIFRVSGVLFVNLQYGDCREELDEARRLFGVEIHEVPGLNLKDDLDGAAALTRAMDLVIGPKTSVTAMAGAVGVPTWLLNLDSDWTMLGTGRMPWFPSVRTFLKPHEQPWESLLGTVAEELQNWCKSGRV